MQLQKKKKLELDVIAVMPEGDLHNLRNKLSSQHSNLNDEVKTKDIEIELCYLDREIEIRKVRKELHAKWLKENPIEYFEDAKDVQEEFDDEDEAELNEDFYG